MLNRLLLARCNAGIPNPAYPSGWFGGLGYDDASHNTFTVSCNNVGGSYPVGPEGCLLWQLTYGSYQVAYGCDPAKTKPVFQQTENQCYNDHVRGWARGAVGCPWQHSSCCVHGSCTSNGWLCTTHIYMPPCWASWLGAGMPAAVVPLLQRG
jgi:hypothetical protein